MVRLLKFRGLGRELELEAEESSLSRSAEAASITSAGKRAPGKNVCCFFTRPHIYAALTNKPELVDVDATTRPGQPY
jgi:hypothetical protein